MISACQFQLFLEHDSNVVIKDDSKKKNIKRLVENINLLLKKYRQEKNTFQKKEKGNFRCVYKIYRMI